MRVLCRLQSNSIAGVIASLLLLLSLWLTSAFADEQRPHRVLIIYQDSTTLPSAIETAQGLSSGFAKLTGTDIEINTEFLDNGHFSGPQHFNRMADVMDAKYANVPLDVVVTLGPEALRFLLQYRGRIAKSASVIFGDISDRTFKRIAPPDYIGGVITAYDIGKTVDIGKALQPDASEIVVMSGSAEFDVFWQENARQVLGTQYQNLPVRYVFGLSLDDFAARASELSPRAILLILTVYEDAEGRKFRPREAMAKIAAASGAPSYGVLGTYMGSGVVGGFAATYRSIGEDVANSVVRLLSGDNSTPDVVQSWIGLSFNAGASTRALCRVM